jgi:hypothetical protein
MSVKTIAECPVVLVVCMAAAPLLLAVKYISANMAVCRLVTVKEGAEALIPVIVGKSPLLLPLCRGEAEGMLFNRSATSAGTPWWRWNAKGCAVCCVCCCCEPLHCSNGEPAHCRPGEARTALEQLCEAAGLCCGLLEACLVRHAHDTGSWLVLVGPWLLAHGLQGLEVFWCCPDKRYWVGRPLRGRPRVLR